MAEPYQRPVARIRKADGGVVGAGFVAPRGVIITCAHVVNVALGDEPLTQNRPAGAVTIDLPWAGNRAYRGTVIDWRPPAQPDSGGNPCVDIAVLSVDAAVPDDVAVTRQPPAEVPENSSFA